MMLPVSLPDHRIVRGMPGAPCRVGPPGPQPGASATGRGGAQRSRLDLVRFNSAVQRASGKRAGGRADHGEQVGLGADRAVVAAAQCEPMAPSSRSQRAI